MKEKRRVDWILFFLLGFAIIESPGIVAADESKPPAEFDGGILAYASTEASGAVAELQRKIDGGMVKLAFQTTNGYLESLLRELRLAPSSQLLVASKTSPNRDLISPKNPRALYFNESVYIAYVPGAPLLELAATDARLGVVFYTLDQKPDVRPRLQRDNRCLECHASSKTLNVPGFLVRSFLTRENGDVDVLSGLMVNHRTPIADRWGGYYVTGTHGSQTHRGNLFGPEAMAHHVQDPSSNGNIIDLQGFLTLSNYPEGGSDIVALMVLEHQIHMQNLLTRITASANESADNRVVYPQIEAALHYLLFLEEAPLRGSIRGTSKFAHLFAQHGPKDAAGRSLREFNLQTRLFKNPCSYLIYSPSFDALPIQAKKHFYRRLWEILSGEDTSPEYQNLSPESRRTIREILVSTKPDLPIYWRL